MKTAGTQSALLLVEDDPGIRRALAEGLSESGYMVVAAPTAEEALSRLNVVAVDLALVDLKLPGMSGLELLRALRQRSPTMVLVIITANPSVNSAIEALHLEAFDYLLKPFTLDQVEQVVRNGLEQLRQRTQREFLLRQMEHSLAGLQALHPFSGPEEDGQVAQAKTMPANPALLIRGPIEIDLQSHMAWADQRELDLTPTEFNLLVTLADSAPAVVSPQELLRQATGYQADPVEARELIKWHVHHLRRKVEREPGDPRYILNVRGVGYRLAVG